MAEERMVGLDFPDNFNQEKLNSGALNPRNSLGKQEPGRKLMENKWMCNFEMC